MADEKRPFDVDGLNGASGIQTVMVDVPSNSSKAPNGNKNPRTKLIVEKNEVIKKKPGVGKTIIGLFFNEDTEDVPKYLLKEVLVPAVKRMLSDLLVNTADGLDTVFFGDSGRKRSGRNGGLYDYTASAKRKSAYEPVRRSARFENPIFTSRLAAKEILDEMSRILDEYSSVSIGDVKSMIGEESSFTDEEWGWEDLSRVSIQNVRDGHMLNLPKPIYLKN